MTLTDLLAVKQVTPVLEADAHSQIQTILLNESEYLLNNTDKCTHHPIFSQMY